jgi:hypothetical protein
MKYTLIPVIIMLLLSSCSTYEYLRVASPGMTSNDNKDLVWENDTVRLSYSFHGKNGPMKLSIYNKTGKPLFIDWKRSALIRDRQSVSLFDSRVDWSGNSSGVSFSVARQVAYNKGVYSGTMNLPEGIEMVAPQAYINKDLFSVYAGPELELLDSTTVNSLPPQKTIRSSDNFDVKYRSIDYSTTASPVQFSMYLTFVLGNDNDGKGAFSLTHAFYISSIMQSDSRPDDFPLYGKEGNQFYLRGKSN